jgi:hypothetical protein
VVSHDGFTEVRQRLDLRADRSFSLALPAAVHPPRVIKRPAPPVPVRREVARPDPAPVRAAGSAAPRGDPNLDIRLSR